MVNNLFITSVSKSHTVSLDSSQVQGNKQFNIHYSPIGAVTILLLYDKAVNKKTIIFFCAQKHTHPYPNRYHLGYFYSYANTQMECFLVLLILVPSASNYFSYRQMAAHTHVSSICNLLRGPIMNCRGGYLGPTISCPDCDHVPTLAQCSPTIKGCPGTVL